MKHRDGEGMQEKNSHPKGGIYVIEYGDALHAKLEAADKMAAAVNTAHNILCCEAAEYVPAIRDAMKVLDKCISDWETLNGAAKERGG